MEEPPVDRITLLFNDLKTEIERLQAENALLRDRLMHIEVAKLPAESLEELHARVQKKTASLERNQAEMDTLHERLAQLTADRDAEARKLHPHYNAGRVQQYEAEQRTVRARIEQLKASMKKRKTKRTLALNAIERIEAWKREHPGMEVPQRPPGAAKRKTKKAKVGACVACRSTTAAVKYRIEGTPYVVCSKACGDEFLSTK